VSNAVTDDRSLTKNVAVRGPLCWFRAEPAHAGATAGAFRDELLCNGTATALAFRTSRPPT
jgi:hypothetical protein